MISRLYGQIKKHGRILKTSLIFTVALTVVANFPVQFVKSVSILDGKEKINLYTFDGNAESILSANEIDLNGKDNIKVTNENADITIKIDRSVPVTLTVGDMVTKVNTSAATVGDFLNEMGYTVDNYDEINYSTDTPITENMSVTYADVEYKTSTTTKTVKYSTKTVKTTALKAGTKKVAKKGVNGTRENITFTKYVNGVPAETTVSSAVTKKPVKKVVKLGVKKTHSAVNTAASGKSGKGGTAANTSGWMSDLKPSKTIKLDKNGVPVSYKKLLTGQASAYCTGTTCSTGVGVKQGYIAVDPNIIPYGTKMYIRTPDGSWIYGYAVAADTGGFTSWGNTIADLYMYSYSDCVNFGRRNIEIYILN